MKTGAVLLSVVATKTILFYGVDANALRYVTFNRILQAEVGVTHNEPASLAVEQAIEEAVLQLIVEGSAQPQAAAPAPAQPQIKQFAGLSSSPGAAPQTPAVSPQQRMANTVANAATGQAQAQPQVQQPAPLPFAVQPRTLEDEVPISPR